MVIKVELFLEEKRKMRRAALFYFELTFLLFMNENRNYSAQTASTGMLMKSGHLPWKSKRSASDAVMPCFLQVVM
jgi:hypothetical protein